MDEVILVVDDDKNLLKVTAYNLEEEPVSTEATVDVCEPKQELEALTSSPGTALRPSRGRVAKAATAYTLFVGLIAFNLVNLGLIPSGVLY